MSDWMNNAPVELWRGTANAWECDHLGHLNTRFYVRRAEFATAALLAELRLDAMMAGRVVIETQHLRFHREVRAGTAIHATGGVTRWGERDAELVILLFHSADDRLAATFRLTVTLRPEAWPAAAMRLAATLMIELPDQARPRGLQPVTQASAPSRAGAAAAGMARTGLLALPSDQCDANGRWLSSAAMGLVADSIAHMRHGPWRETLAATADGAGRIGSALVEFEFLHHDWPRIGDRVEVRSGLAGCTDRVTYGVHWLFDPATDALLATVRTVGVALDLDARRPIALTPEAQAAYRLASVAL
jgi:acyl-CoA thioester hydrolase